METINELNFYKSITLKRESQANDVYRVLNEHFNFENIECIETGSSQNLDDGCFGLYLGKITESLGGIYNSVDIEADLVAKSEILFKQYIPKLNINHHISDSVTYLKNYEGNPNLIHLDSWDLDLTNPVPSMLHGWLEFDAIKDKMPSGSIVIVDDNFLKDTWVNWNEMIHGQYTGNFKRIDITYDIVGKGALIYHWCQKEETDWDIVGDHYKAGNNIKLIIKKR